VPGRGVMRKVRFAVQPWGDEPSTAQELVPYVDGVSLVELVAGFEQAARFDVVGGYAGIVLDHFNFGDLIGYLTGQPDSLYWARHGAISLLGCDCGDVGCWPLDARVITDGAVVTWRGFTQPHRPNRDYSCFGPFVFRRAQYEHAVRQAVQDTCAR